jgi:hypothetical protein
VFDVNVLRFVRSYRIVGEFHGSLVVFVDCRGAALPLVDIVHELPQVHGILIGPAHRHSASVIERATASCCLEFQLTAPPLSITTSHDCDRLVVASAAHSESENTLMSSALS